MTLSKRSSERPGDREKEGLKEMKKWTPTWKLKHPSRG